MNHDHCHMISFLNFGTVFLEWMSLVVANWIHTMTLEGTSPCIIKGVSSKSSDSDPVTQWAFCAICMLLLHLLHLAESLM